MDLVLYDLAGADPALRFSPHCWKIRMALAHKGLSAQTVPWRFTDKAALAFSGHSAVPVLVDRGKTIGDSWAIAGYLEDAFPDRPSLFGGAPGRAMAGFINAWADAALVPALARLLLTDIHAILAACDKAYFRTSREGRFGMTLEAAVADRAAHREALRVALTPLRRALRDQPFIAGEAPNYADYAVFGMFMWARCVRAEDVLAPEDSVAPWRARMLDLFDGLARGAPRIT